MVSFRRGWWNLNFRPKSTITFYEEKINKLSLPWRWFNDFNCGYSAQCRHSPLIKWFRLMMISISYFVSVAFATRWSYVAFVFFDDLTITWWPYEGDFIFLQLLLMKWEGDDIQKIQEQNLLWNFSTFIIIIELIEFYVIQKSI